MAEPTDGDPAGPDDRVVVETAAEAAEGVVFEHYRQSELRDVDVTVSFEDGVLDVDVYVNPPAGTENDPDEPDAEAVADEAARAARDAVDELFADG